MNINGVRQQVAAILRQFPSGQAEVYRPTLNSYGEETGTKTKLGDVTVWWVQPERPKKVSADEKGVILEEDGRKYVCLLWEETLPQAQRGDLMTCDGKTWRIRNTDNRLNVRVFWQVEEV